MLCFMGETNLKYIKYLMGGGRRDHGSRTDYMGKIYHE